jgi:ATP-dependent DNA helicase RecQ
VLAGAVDSVVKADRCAHYGALTGFSQSSLGRAVDQLVEAELLCRDPHDEYRRLSVTAAGREALQRDEQVILANPHRPAPPRPPRPSRSTIQQPKSRVQNRPVLETAPTEGEEDRFEQLRAWRRIEAQRAQLPPYVICHDSTLRAIARANPKTLAELGVIPGMGARRIESHGAVILELLNANGTTELETESQP